MANLLGVTNPVPGYDSTNVNRNLPISPNDTQIQNITDPSRVGRPDARTDRQDSSDTTGSEQLRYDSNFQTFLQRLKHTPELSTILSKLFTSRQGIMLSSGLQEGIAAEFSRLLELLPMDQAQLLSFLNTQLKSGNRFGGALFQLLRDAYSSTLSEGMKTDILQFLKRYSDASSSAHIEGNILRNLKGIATSIPARWSNHLMELIAQLENGIASGDQGGNLKLLQGEIFPYMSRYVEQTHDMGIARNLLTLLALDTARYESGAAQSLLSAFHSLNGYTVLNNKLGNMDDETLLRLLGNTEFLRASQDNRFADQLVALASRALQGEGGVEVERSFRQIISAILVNESVYMPLTHLFLPMQWEGKLVFSELWVDPDAERESGRESGKDQETASPATRVLLKLDIQDLGLFDMILACRNEDISLQIYCPKQVASFSAQIEPALSHILTEHGLHVESVHVSQMEKPLTISEVFPKLFEGKGSINVKI